MMIICGLVELAFGIDAERRSLESIARPLTAAGPVSPKDSDGARPAASAGATSA